MSKANKQIPDLSATIARLSFGSPLSGYKTRPAPIETYRSCINLPLELQSKLGYITLQSHRHDERLIEFDPGSRAFTLIRCEYGEVKSEKILAWERGDGRFILAKVKNHE